ncbi:hypothetical protein RHD99_13825 [Buttiauxella selenatireducens]|uniref:DUF7480 domain-containing protein n=1 Tax=Buttiauxella selenatireducens TaxID=3073902 RepID=A0ABY9S4Y2_9ENTR|nr:putative T6SS immunity periplasmic lipoprotein [Buttiauxella sp. R73]WMY72559.1 hypothetical protein RHD99_13825 [Buttiauxella sp. R73]
MIKKIQHMGLLFPLVIVCSFMLTGCPGPGDRITFDETTQVATIGSHLCFLVPESQDYQPTVIAINPRGTPPKSQNFNLKPDIKVADGKLCIPHSFYQFPDEGQFIVEYILASREDKKERRSVVVGVGVSEGHFYNFPLTNMEINRPYTEINQKIK